MEPVLRQLSEPPFCLSGEVEHASYRDGNEQKAVGGGTGILIGTGDLGMVRNAGRPLPQVSERTREKCWRALGDDFRTFLGEFVSS